MCQGEEGRHKPKLVIQTRSPDVVRDCDLFGSVWYWLMASIALKSARPFGHRDVALSSFSVSLALLA